MHQYPFSFYQVLTAEISDRFDGSFKTSQLPLSSDPDVLVTGVFVSSALFKLIDLTSRSMYCFPLKAMGVHRFFAAG